MTLDPRYPRSPRKPKIRDAWSPEGALERFALWREDVRAIHAYYDARMTVRNRADTSDPVPPGTNPWDTH